ncbi:bile acid:sodium symporter family protein [Swingsia samuiensis]|uniref:Bile acid:sodium symporter n=1 Tax=Swingsia samuiensis TaxID=1293412 RepID=A0A4Y6UH41_9PROT|nr:bile acid:sodium symporter family protein [Swingsia samuiensis]QDH16883.1 bile acid:sodium symporter [Swingsia samuiensis]
MKRLDPFLMSLVVAIILASIFPASGGTQKVLERLTYFLISMMFFFQGVRLERKFLLESLKNWTLQLSVLFFTFIFFPFMGVFFYFVCNEVLKESFFEIGLWQGILFLCCLPSTVQSSIALTSIARGNIPASICASTTSNILGIFITPFLFSILIGSSNGNLASYNTIIDIVKELLIPFILGQICQKWLYRIIKKNKILISFTDRGSILFVVYSAFSSAVLEGIWRKVSALHIAEVFFIDFLMLAVVLYFSYYLAKKEKQSLENSISLQFCGSKKSLASGIPMASIIFPHHEVGIIVIPLIIYHQIQLFVCTILARKYSQRL